MTSTVDIDRPSNGREMAAQEFNLRYRVNLFSGEFEAVQDDPNADFAEINRRLAEKAFKPPKRRTGANPWYKDRVCNPMSLQPEQATPERIERENAEAKRHGTGAWYDKEGICHLPTRGSRAREGRRRGFQDNNAGFGDYAGR